MTVSVGPTNKRNTHHIKLTKGADEIGLILCNAEGEADERAYRRDPMPGTPIKMFQGEQEYGDESPPWTQTAQKNWGGGRGLEDADADRTRYYDDHRINATIDGEASVWGLESWGSGIVGNGVVGHGWHGVGTTSDDHEIVYESLAIYGLSRYVAVPVALSGTITIARLFTYLKRVGNPATMAIYLVADSSGSPGAKPASSSGTVGLSDFDYPSVWKLYSLSVTPIASASGTYWVVFEGSANDDVDDHWEILMSNTSHEGHIKSTAAYTVPTSWLAYTTESCYCRLTEAPKSARVHHARLKWLDYIAFEYLDGTVSKVYQNGTGGVATSATASTLVDTNNTHLGTNDRWNKDIIMLIGGKGADVPRPWREISDCTGASSTITIDAADPWDITPDNTTEYVILGSNEWIEVTGHGLGAGEQIKTAVSMNGAIYFGCGDSVDIVRLRRYWASSTYFQWADDTSNKATILKKQGSGTAGKIWKATRSRPATIAVADAVDCTGTGAVGALSFGTALNIGDMAERINGLEIHGDDTPLINILKEGSIHYMVGSDKHELRISDLESVMDPNNGYASVVHNSFLYFSYEQGVERYSNDVLESVGPNLDAGLPVDRKGYVVQLVNYPGFVLAVVDGGASNYSSILVYSGLGYCEMWRAPAKGLRIFNAWVQSMPGDLPNRLWINCNGDLLWVPIATNLAKGYYTSGQSHVINFAPGGHLITGYYSFSRKLLEKLFNTVGLVTENTVPYNRGLTVLYQLDNSSAWYKINNSFDTFAETAALSTSDVTGRRIRFLIEIEPYYGYQAIKLLALVIEALTMGEYRYRDTFTFRIADRDMQLDGTTPDDKTGAQKFDLLNAWVESAGTVTMNFYDGEMDSKRIKLDAMPIRILKHMQDINRNVYICQISGYELS